jgi:hypothetical protein
MDNLSSAVEATFTDCTADDDTLDTLEVEGIVHTARFDRTKVLARQRDIALLLDELPIEFKSQEQGGGDGHSFLNACNDRNGNQWTGFHLTMEQLFLLGIATGQAEWCLPRELWEVFPGGMPYIKVTPKL